MFKTKSPAMPKMSSRKSDRSACLFVVSNEPPPTELIEWPEDEAQAAIILAECRRLGDAYRALLAAGHDEARWQGPSLRMLTARLEYERVHPEVGRVVGREPVYDDAYRRFLVALARGPGEGMTLGELAYYLDVPAAMLNEWLSSEATSSPSSV